MDFGALHSPDFGGEFFQRGRHQRGGGNEMGVAVALHHLVGNGGHLQPQALADPFLNVRRDGGVGAYGAGDLAHAHRFPRRRHPFPLAAQLVPPEGQLEPEGDGLGVHAVGASHHQGVLVPEGLLPHGGAGGVNFRQQQVGGGHQLQGLAGVQHIR